MFKCIKIGSKIFPSQAQCAIGNQWEKFWNACQKKVKDFSIPIPHYIYRSHLEFLREKLFPLEQIVELNKVNTELIDNIRVVRSSCGNISLCCASNSIQLCDTFDCTLYFNYLFAYIRYRGWGKMFVWLNWDDECTQRSDIVTAY